MTTESTPTPNPDVQDSHEVFDLLTDLEDRLGKLKHWQQENDQQVAQIHNAFEQIDLQRQSLDHAGQDLGQRENALAARHDELQQLKQEVDRRRDELNGRGTELDDRSKDINRQETELAQSWQELDEANGQLEQQQQQQVCDQERRVDEQQRLVEQQQNELQAARQKLETARQEARKLQDHLQTEREEIATDWVDLQLREEALKVQQLQLEKTRRQFASEAAGKGRKQVDPNRSPAGLKQQRDELMQRADRITHQQQELEQAARELDEREARIEAKQLELNERAADGELAGSDQVDAQRRQLEQQADQINQRQKQLDQAARDLDEREADLESRQLELDERLAAVQQSGSADPGHESEQLQLKEKDFNRRNAQLQQKIQQLKRAATAVRKRRKKMRGYIEGLRERARRLDEAEGQVAAAGAQHAGLKKERQMLIEVKRFLEASEAEMVRKWATHGASSRVIGTLIALAILAGFSYLVGQKAVLPVWEATMALSLAAPMGPDAPAATAWLSGQRQDLTSEIVLRETLSQLDQRGMRLFSSVQELTQRLRTNLNVSGRPGQIDLAYRSTNRDEVVTVLEALGRGFLGYRLGLDRQAGRGDSTQIVRPATRTVRPVEDRQLVVGAATFGASAFAALLAMLIMRVWLAKQKRVLDPADEPAMQMLENMWSPNAEPVESE